MDTTTFSRKQNLYRDPTRNVRRRRSRLVGGLKTLQLPDIAEKTTEEVEETPTKKTDRKTLDKAYKNMLGLPDTGEVSLFKNNNYQVF